MKILCFLLALAILALSASCSSTEPGTQEINTPELRLFLSSDKTEDKSSIVKLTFNVSKDWHIYGPKPQKNGRATSVEFFVNEKQIADNQWPDTKIFDEGESGPSDGYDGSFEVKAKFEQSAAVERLNAKVSWVACKDICVPGEAELEIKVRE